VEFYLWAVLLTYAFSFLNGLISLVTYLIKWVAEWGQYRQTGKCRGR
jgi:hypothetical protein